MRARRSGCEPARGSQRRAAPCMGCAAPGSPSQGSWARALTAACTGTTRQTGVCRAPPCSHRSCLAAAAAPAAPLPAAAAAPGQLHPSSSSCAWARPCARARSHRAALPPAAASSFCAACWMVGGACPSGCASADGVCRMRLVWVCRMFARPHVCCARGSLRGAANTRNTPQHMLPFAVRPTGRRGLLAAAAAASAALYTSQPSAIHADAAPGGSKGALNSAEFKPFKLIGERAAARVRKGRKGGPRMHGAPPRHAAAVAVCACACWARQGRAHALRRPHALRGASRARGVRRAHHAATTPARARREGEAHAQHVEVQVRAVCALACVHCCALLQRSARPPARTHARPHAWRGL